MKYKYNFSGEISWDTAYQMEGPPVKKEAKVVVIFCGEGGRTIVSLLVWPNQTCLVGKGWYHSHLYSFHKYSLGLLCILKQKGGKVGWLMEGLLSIRLKSPKDWGKKKLRKWVGGFLF